MSELHGRARVSGVRVAWRTAPRGSARRAVADDLVALLVREAGGAGVTVERRCDRCGATDHGRPIVRGASVLASISYAGDLAVVAVADAARVLALGIDAERRRRPHLPDLRGVMAPGRRTSLRRWTRVEAVLKADGRGLAVEPGRVRIERSVRGIRGALAGDRGGAGALGIRPVLRRVRGPRGVVISLAVASV